jgi:hypothetical protein
MFVIVAVYDFGELARIIQEHEAAGSESWFDITAELNYRYDHCDYHLLFFCRAASHEAVLNLPGCDRPDAATRFACTTEVDDRKFNFFTDPDAAWHSWPFVGMVGEAILTTPRIPDAVIYMLRTRWRKTRLDFGLGVFFALAWITLMVVALRAKEIPFLWFALMVVLGPYLLMAFFWILQRMFGSLAPEVRFLAAYLINLIGVPGCVTVCCAHDFKEVAEIFKLGRHVPKL